MPVATGSAVLERGSRAGPTALRDPFSVAETLATLAAGLVMTIGVGVAVAVGVGVSAGIGSGVPSVFDQSPPNPTTAATASRTSTDTHTYEHPGEFREW